MYESIYVPVDNSPHSNRAVDNALALGRAFDARLTGCHVYAAKMHDYRFKQMEFTLPEEYLVETELARQRKIHDSLITMGLELISDCYLEDMDHRAQAVGLACERKMMDGKHAVEILKDIGESDYDLVVLGAVGIGRTKDSQVGSVASRVAREADRDTWIVKHVPDAKKNGAKKNGAKKNGNAKEAASEATGEPDTILVGVDGSPQSFGALMTGIELAKRFGKKLEVVGVYDPYLHYAVFKGVVEVLTDKAAKVFRFEEQNQLHEEIIDTGLAQIYQSHLNVAASLAEEHGVEATKTLLDGKAYQKVLDHARKIQPWVLVIGRVGVHANEGDDLGSNTENLLRLAPCDVLLTNRTFVPELDLKAEESIHWTPEAEERMTRVPEMVLPIARTAILRLAIEQGHSVVSSDLVTEAMDRFMPKRTADLTERLAEAVAFDKARKGSVSVCKQCGLAAKTDAPELCTVCGARDFETVTSEMIEAMVEAEGGTEEETTYDGRKLAWTQEARKALRAIDDRYQRRRAKARIEKAAHGQKMDPITLDFANRFIEEETGILYKPKAEAAPVAETASASLQPDTDVATEAPPEPSEEDDDLKIVARDAEGLPLLSRRAWADDAIARVLRVPSGFMRDKTQDRVEALAEERGADRIDLALVEDGIELGKKLMAEMIAQQEAEQAAAANGNGHATNGNGHANGTDQAAATTAGKCPFSSASTQTKSDATRAALNEVGRVSEMVKRQL